MATPNKTQRFETAWNARFPYVAFPFSCLGIGFVFSAFFTIVYNHADLFPTVNSEILFIFANWTFAGAAIAGIVFGCVATLSNATAFLQKRSRAWWRDFGTIASLAMAVFCLAPFSAPAFGEGGPILQALSGIVFGAASVATACAWGTVFARLEPQAILFNAAAALIAASIASFATRMLPAFEAQMIAAVICLAISVFFLRMAFSKDAAESQSHDSEVDPTISKGRRALKALWMPLVGGVIASFIFGLTWDSAAASTTTSVSVVDFILKMLVGPILTAGIIMAAVLRNPDSSVLRFVQSLLFPIAILILLLIPVLPSGGQLLSWGMNLLLEAAFSVIVVIVWTVISNTSRVNAIPAAVVASLCLGLMAGFVWVGMHLIYFIGLSGQTLCLILLAIYLAAIVASFAIDSRTERSSHVDDGASTSAATSIQKRCDELAREHSLSPREIEVLYLLGRGYNHGYIATRLFISENTVRTHVRHIYTKLDVSSREDLIELIDQAG